MGTSQAAERGRASGSAHGPADDQERRDLGRPLRLAQHRWPRSCTEWVDVRIRPAPIKTETSFGEYIGPPREAARPSPPIAAPSSIKATLVPDLARHKGKRNKLRCTDGKTTVEDPPVGEPFQQAFDVVTEYGRTDLVWLSADPPIFELGNHDFCQPCPSRVIFERCHVSERYTSVDVGPDNILAFRSIDKSHASNLILFSAGRELATIPNYTQFGFVP